MDDTREPRENLCVKIFKKCLRFLISHVGLTCAIVAYTFLGAVIFQHLEQPLESHVRQKVADWRMIHTQNLWVPTKDCNVLSEKKWKEEVDRELQDFQGRIYKAVKDGGWDGRDVGDEPQWSFARSLLFAVTLITTIGYGDIAPKSMAGRLVTIFYALIGIPLLMICLANTGKLLAGCFRFLYASFLDCTCRCDKTCMANCPKSRCRTLRKNSRQNVVYQRGVEMVDSNQRINVVELTPEVTFECETTPGEETVEEIYVPIWICLLIMAFYTSLGATLFSYWENWTYFESCYFCFVTLSTIGIGDFVPGTSVESWHSQEKRVICALYLLFGLTLLAMCFNLIQDHIRKLTRKIGINIHLLD